MSAQNLKSILTPPHNLGELELLRNYNNYIIEQIDSMNLHPIHKDDVKVVLLKAINDVVDIQLLQPSKPKTQNLLFRLFQKTTR